MCVLLNTHYSSFLSKPSEVAGLICVLWLNLFIVYLHFKELINWTSVIWTPHKVLYMNKNEVGNFHPILQSKECIFHPKFLLIQSKKNGKET